MHMTVRFALTAVFAVCLPALAQPNIVRDDHDRRVRNETEHNTKYHNNADDYPKRTPPKPVPPPVRRAPPPARPVYVPPPRPVATSSNRTYTPNPAPAPTVKSPLSPSLYHTADAELSQAENQLFSKNATSAQTTASLGTIEAKASQGFPRAQFLLGRAYEEGNGHLINNAEALRLYQSSAQLGDSQANYRLVMARWNGELNYPVDGQPLLALLEKQGSAADPGLHYQAGDAYRTGTHGLPFDLARANQYFEAAAKYGSTAGQARMADNYFRGIGVAQDFNKAAQLAQQSLSAQPISATVLAFLYRVGVGGLPRDPAQSLAMMKDAADRGNAFGKAELARGFDGNPTESGSGLPYSEMKRTVEANGLALPPMNERAADVFQRLGANNPRFTIVQLAKFHKSASEVEKAANEKDKLKQFKELAKIDWQNVYLLGRAYLHGDGVTVERERARNLLNWSCYEGFLKEACEQLAWAYYFEERAARAVGKVSTGSSMFSVTAAKADRDAPTAVSAYLCAIGEVTLFFTAAEQRSALRRAAAGGIADAQIELGYLGLKGAPADRPEGLRYLEMAAKSDPNGMYALGVMLANGYYDVAEDRPRAIALFRAAAAEDQINAIHMLALAYEKGIVVKMDHPTALQWAMKAALAGHAKDQLLVARLLQNGMDVPSDPAKSLEWMQKAAANGDPVAKAELAKGFTGR